MIALLFPIYSIVYINACISFLLYPVLRLAEDLGGFVVMRLADVESNFGGKEINRLTVLEKIYFQ